MIFCKPLLILVRNFITFRHRNTEILALKLGIGNQFKCFLRVGFQVELGDTYITYGGSDAIFVEFLQHQWRVIEAFDRSAVFTQNIGYHDVAGA